jgi:hypothetical protein
MITVAGKHVNNFENGMTFLSPQFNSGHGSYMCNGTYAVEWNEPSLNPVYVYPQEFAVPD